MTLSYYARHSESYWVDENSARLLSLIVGWESSNSRNGAKWINEEQNQGVNRQWQEENDDYGEIWEDEKNQRKNPQRKSKNVKNSCVHMRHIRVLLFIFIFPFMRFIDEWEINKTHWEIFQSLLVHVLILWFEFSCSSEKHETFIHFRLLSVVAWSEISRRTNLFIFLLLSVVCA